MLITSVRLRTRWWRSTWSGGPRCSRAARRPSRCCSWRRHRWRCCCARAPWDIACRPPRCTSWQTRASCSSALAGVGCGEGLGPSHGHAHEQQHGARSGCGRCANAPPPRNPHPAQTTLTRPRWAPGCATTANPTHPARPPARNPARPPPCADGSDEAKMLGTFSFGRARFKHFLDLQVGQAGQGRAGGLGCCSCRSAQSEDCWSDLIWHRPALVVVDW